MEISVVVSTYNNREVLRHTLAHLAAQAFPREQYEVVVADDGSTDGTAEMVRSLVFPVPLRYIARAHTGTSAVRNVGWREARGRIVLFVDSDFWAEPDLLASHHGHYLPGAAGIAVQGRSMIHPDSLTTPFMRVKEISPDLTIRSRHRMSPYHVVARNFSMLRADLEAAGGFDEGFPGYGYEDLDLALRMTARGVVFEYEPEARGFHHHVETLDGVRRKLYEAGLCAVYVWRKHGRTPRLGLFLEIQPWMLPFKWLVFRTPLVMPLLHRLVSIGERRGWLLILNECYKNLLQEAYYAGVFAAWRAPEPEARATAAARPAHGGADDGLS
ncbi:MAG TPA: glycosyltransferase [bacterium]|nr:glycosyltransferase [bacterium]